MAANTHWKSMYGDLVQRLIGNQYKSLLAALFGKANKKGDAVFFDAIAPSDDVTVTAMSSDTAHRLTYETLSSPALSDWVALHTPHMDVDKQRTICLPSKVEFGHVFRDIDEVAENASDHSDVLRAGMGQIMRQRDYQILTALFASTASRGKDSAALSNVAFPAGQQINEADGVFDLNTITSIRKTFENNYCDPSERIVCVLSPAAKKNLIDGSRSTIRSTDFVDSAKYFATGELPDVEGVSLITHPLVSSFAGAYTDCFVAFQMSAGKLNTFKALATDLAVDPGMKFQWTLYLRELIGACRIDDKKVIQGTLGTAAS